MLSNILNSIPVVGHVKGALHYIACDYEGCKNAMYESTRSTALIAGGALGSVGGPAGMALGGAAAGMFVDSVTSIATGKPEGSLAGVGEIVSDIGHGKFPVESVVKTGAMVGSDVLCGMGGSIVTNIAETAVKSTGKSIGTEILKKAIVSEGKTLLTAGICAQAGLVSEIRTAYKYKDTRFSSGSGPKPPPSTASGSGSKSPPSTASGSGSKPPPSTANGSRSKPPPSTASGSGSDPPKNNKEIDKKPHEIEEPKPEEPDHWSIFLKIFKAKSLDDISIRGRNIFASLVRGRKTKLKQSIKKLIAGGYFEETMKLVLEILNSTSIAEEDIVFENFLSFTQFVDTYIGNRVAEHEPATKFSDTAESSFEALKERTLRTVMDDISTLTKDMLDTFENLRKEISEFSFEPYFRNIFSAVYHYYKHRVVEKKGIVLTVSKYIDLIKSLLKKLKTLKVYTELESNRGGITFDRYFEIYETRVRIVVKFQGGQVVLSSCYLLNDCYDDDKDGDEFIDSKKIDET